MGPARPRTDGSRRMLAAVVACVALWAPRAHADCDVVIAPQAAQRVFAQLRDPTPGERCVLTGLEAAATRIEARYAMDERPMPALVLEPVACAGASSIRGEHFAVTASADFTAACPRTVDRAVHVTAELSAPTAAQAHLSNRTATRRAWVAALAALVLAGALCARALRVR